VRCRRCYCARGDDERLDIETPDELPVALSLMVRLDIALVPSYANGPAGFWITKKSKSMFRGSPSTSTRISSTGPFD
jgi:hypothetical protein